jgi:hypothetical protein
MSRFWVRIKMRYRLRTLVIMLAAMPPMLAVPVIAHRKAAEMLRANKLKQNSLRITTYISLRLGDPRGPLVFTSAIENFPVAGNSENRVNPLHVPFHDPRRAVGDVIPFARCQEKTGLALARQLGFEPRDNRTEYHKKHNEPEDDYWPEDERFRFLSYSGALRAQRHADRLCALARHVSRSCGFAPRLFDGFIRRKVVAATVALHAPDSNPPALSYDFVVGYFLTRLSINHSAKYMMAADSARIRASGMPHQNAANDSSQPPISNGIIAVTTITLTDSNITTNAETSGTI